MKRTDIINKLIKFHGYQSYLEIGVDDGINIKAINIAEKTGVDPDPKTKIYYPEIISTTSDDFFKNNNKTFDIIFIDGLHHADQVYKDIYNSLHFLNSGGTIVLHDMLPTDEGMLAVPRIQSVWTGDCWQAFVTVRSENKDLAMQVVNTDFGCGIICKGKQELISYKKLDYSSFVANKQEWMNIISVDDFNKKFT